MNLKQELVQSAKNAKEASRCLVNISASEKNKILREMARSLESRTEFILQENKKDLKAAKISWFSWENKLEINVRETFLH